MEPIGPPPHTNSAMAKILPGPLVSEIRNRLGAQVFSRNPSGAYVKAFVEPDNTETDRRAVVKVIWSDVAARWNEAIDDDQRAAWQAYALENHQSKSPITPKTLDGRKVFFRLNCRLGLYGADYLDDPPTGQNVQNITMLELAADADDGSLALTFSPSPLPAEHPMIIFASPCCNLGRMNPAALMNFITYLDPGATSPASIAPEWLDKYGTIDPSTKIFARARLLNTANGAYSVPQQAVALVTGTGDAMLHASIRLTPSQIQNLMATPATLIPAPGPNKVLQVFTVSFSTLAGTTPYTLPNPLPGDLNFWLDPDANENINLPNAGKTWFADALARTWPDLKQYILDNPAFGNLYGSWGGVLTNYANQPYILNLYGASTELADGDSEWQIDVWYATIDLS